MLENIGKKLVGNDEERAVSPVIGVILMVAITVILAAVIAAFVLDLGGSVSQEAQAGVNIDINEENGSEEIRVEVTSLGNADHVNIGGDATSLTTFNGSEELEVGDTLTHDGNSGENGTITAIAVIEEDGTETVVASDEYDF
ncbi:type IV pilin [Halosolutus amylolyticus]|uniref:Type IV pilin n=1 Tax=Halosolutus amylolyticus TaxID=2932267 RepID=A0ABD5PQ50_9EURY|nr:type IV pilin N-terminal domain-containing protein [Halosolutus amylolyticus]